MYAMRSEDSGPQTAPYGTWDSPISAAMVASAGIDLGHVTLDGDDVYWRERRPKEDGRGVIVTGDGTTATDVTLEGTDVRTLVHEYGGGDFTVHEGVVYYVRYDDQRVYRQLVNGEPEPITPAPETDQGVRYADFAVSGDGRFLYCVREDHDVVAEGGDHDEPETALVRLTADGSGRPTVVASGHDFYAAPCVAPAGDRLAWLTWDHPGMPWDGTELHVAEIDTDGTLADPRTVMGGPTESVFQPAWRPDGTLHAVSDRTGWWNLYRRQGDEWVPYREEAAEYGVPQWVFGLATYAFLDDGRVVTRVSREGEQTIEILSPDGARHQPDIPYTVVRPRIRSAGDAIVTVAGGPGTPNRLVKWVPGSDPVVLRRTSDVDTNLDGAYLATPDHVTIPTRDDAEAYAFVYPPTNPDYAPPPDEQPPLVVSVHGGPTSATDPSFALWIQYFTSRGFAVADVNYRGSTGYGRAYREALYGDWGVTDVRDCVDVARHLAETDRADPARMAIRGGSAGGFVALAALAFHEAFAAGTSIAGVADLERLAELTHKFESRYLDKLVGPYPDAADTYRARSPVNHADGVEVPLLLLQGAEDPVVPLSQAEAMADALATGDVPHDLLVFEGEQHGFRRAESRRRALAAELAFYGEVFGFAPSEENLPTLDLSPGQQS